MQLTYKYKLKPSNAESAQIDRWIELCRRQYNYRLAERFNWYEATRSRVDACPLNVSIVPVNEAYRNIPESKVLAKGKNKGSVYPLIKGGYVNWGSVQKDDLKQMKALFPEYKELDSQLLQNVVERVDKAFERFTQGDSNGKRSGKPKFKGKPYYRSICFPQRVQVLNNGRVILPKLGELRFVQHRPLPEGFTVKTATIIKAAEGYFVAFSLEDKSIPVADVAIHPTAVNSKGIDLGLEYFASCSDGEQIEFPQWFRQSEERIAKLQARKAKMPHGCMGRKILALRIARIQSHVARSRQDWQFKLAYKLFADCDVIFIEDLALKNLIRRNHIKFDDAGQVTQNGQSAKSGLNKSMTDAALGQFVQILQWVAFKLGKQVIKIDPRGTSQHCHACLNKVPKSLEDRWHDCPECQESLPRDVNSGKLIKRIGLTTVGMDTASLKTALIALAA
jgi:putative transposase